MSKAATRKGVAKGQKPIAKKKSKAKVIKPSPDPVEKQKAGKSVPQARKEQKQARKNRLEAKKIAAEGSDIAENAHSTVPVPEQPWDSLQPQQKRFCEEFIIDLNQTAAYGRAGYTGTEPAMRANASRLIANDNVRAYIDFLIQQRAERTNIRADKVLQGLAQIAFSDIRQLFDETGALRDLRTMPDDLAMAVQGVDIFEEYEGVGKERVFIGYTKKLKLANRVDGLVNLGKHLKLFTDTLEVKNPAGETFKTEQVPPNYSKLDARLAKHANRATR